MHGIRSFDDLKKLVEDRNANSNLRRTACWFIARLGDQRAVYPLLKAFKDPDTSVSQEAGVGLGVLGNKRALQPLATTLTRSEDNDRRYIAAYALGLLRDSRSVEPLLATLHDREDDQTVRGHAAEALGNIGDRRAIPFLIEALDDRSAEVRFWGAFALGKLKAIDALPKLKRIGATDRTRVKGWWTIGKEARDAVKAIESALADEV
jgi:HEAT repeat protein